MLEELEAAVKQRMKSLGLTPSDLDDTSCSSCEYEPL